MALPSPVPCPDDAEDVAFRQAVMEGLASLDAGQSVPYEDARRWLLSWGTENELPPPECP
jgi:predicted transcriptional regulator